MIKVTLKNGKEYEVLEPTTVYPSGLPNVRSKMEIYIDESAMTLEALEKVFSDESATDELRITKTGDGGDVAYECLYRHYCIVTSIGKKLVSTTSHETGETTEVMCLCVTLEQRTYVEQKLYEMGVS